MGLARRDYAAVKKRVARVDYRRSVPPWGIPNELLRMLLDPSSGLTRRGAGLGSTASPPETPWIEMVFVLPFAIVRCREQVPLRWHSSWLVEVPKKDAAVGCDAVRDLHLFCALSGAYMATLWHRGSHALNRPCASGYARFRRREVAICISTCVAHRLHALGRGVTELFFDMKNAFGCPHFFELAQYRARQTREERLGIPGL